MGIEPVLSLCGRNDSPPLLIVSSGISTANPWVVLFEWRVRRSQTQKRLNNSTSSCNATASLLQLAFWRVSDFFSGAAVSPDRRQGSPDSRDRKSARSPADTRHETGWKQAVVRSIVLLTVLVTGFAQSNSKRADMAKGTGRKLRIRRILTVPSPELPITESLPDRRPRPRNLYRVWASSLQSPRVVIQLFCHGALNARIASNRLLPTSDRRLLHTPHRSDVCPYSCRPESEHTMFGAEELPH